MAAIKLNKRPVQKKPRRITLDLSQIYDVTIHASASQSLRFRGVLANVTCNEVGDGTKRFTAEGVFKSIGLITFVQRRVKRGRRAV